MWGQRPRHRMRRRNRKAERKETEVERGRQKGREKKRPKTEKETQRNSNEDRGGVGLGGLQTQREGQSEMGPDPMRQLHWGPWRKSLSQSLISCLVCGGTGGNRAGGWAISPRLAPG